MCFFKKTPLKINIDRKIWRLEYNIDKYCVCVSNGGGYRVCFLKKNTFKINIIDRKNKFGG